MEGRRDAVGAPLHSRMTRVIGASGATDGANSGTEHIAPNLHHRIATHKPLPSSKHGPCDQWTLPESGNRDVTVVISPIRPPVHK
jgi:hypothetical protein